MGAFDVEPAPLTEEEIGWVKDGTNESRDWLSRQRSEDEVELVSATLETMHYDPYSDQLTIHRVSDINPVLEQNARIRADAQTGSHGYSPSRELRYVAQIPEGLYFTWLQMGINVLKDEDWPKVAALLDDPDYEKIRVSPGRISRRRRRWHTTEGFRKG